MKAKVIKEFEMYGITHKVGEIMNISLHSPGGLPMISDRDAFLLDNGFIEEIKEPTRWKPEADQKYYFLNNDGSVGYNHWDGDHIDRNRFEIGNCFKTVEEAEKAVEYLKALAVVRGDATTKFVNGEYNWYVYFDIENGLLLLDTTSYSILNGVFGLPYFATEDDARMSIELHKNEWLAIFGVKEEV